MPVNLVILSEIRLYREGLALTVMGEAEDIQVVGACGDTDSAELMVDLYPGAVVLVDVAMRDVKSVIRSLASKRPAPRLVALALTPGSDPSVVKAAEHGFSGLVLPNASAEELIATVQRAARGELLCSPEAAAGLAQKVAKLTESQEVASSSQKLTGREMEVAELLESGLSNKQIARLLSIRLATVKNHVHNILSKLNVERRGEAAAVLRLESPDVFSAKAPVEQTGVAPPAT